MQVSEALKLKIGLINQHRCKQG